MRLGLDSIILLAFIFLNLTVGAATYTSDFVTSMRKARFFKVMYNKGYMLEHTYKSGRKRWCQVSRNITTVIISEKEKAIYTCYIGENGNIIIDKNSEVVYDSFSQEFKNKTSEFDEYGELIIKDNYNVG